MKNSERITEGNLIAVCAAGFSLGALTAWGIFYEYRCAPGIKPLDAGVWAQVLVAAVVGAAAVYVPKQIANSEERRRSDIFVTLLRNVLAPAITLANLFANDRPNLVLTDGLMRDLKLQIAALESYPIADIPSAALLLHSVEAKSQCPSLANMVTRLLPALEAGVALQPNQIAAIKVLGAAILQLASDVDGEALK